MKKLLLVLALTLPATVAFTTPQLETARLTANNAAPAILVPAGFMTIGNEEIESIELEPGTENVLFKGKGGGQKSGKVARGYPGGRQGGHMTVFDDYKVAGLAGGNVVFFDDATNTLFITEVTEEEILIVKQTAVTLN